MIETGVMCGMLLSVESNASAVKTVDTGLQEVAGGNFIKTEI